MEDQFILDPETTTNDKSANEKLIEAIQMSYIVNKIFLTPSEAGMYLGASLQFVKSMMAANEIPVYSLSSKKNYIKREDLDNYVLRRERMIMSSYQRKLEARKMIR